jgi:hypothetical protein
MTTNNRQFAFRRILLQVLLLLLSSGIAYAAIYFFTPLAPQPRIWSWETLPPSTF